MKKTGTIARAPPEVLVPGIFGSGSGLVVKFRFRSFSSG